MRLRCHTSAEWVEHAVAHFDEVLVDHAHCEKKAAANALSLLQAYPEMPKLPGLMARLAREECAHLAKVLALMDKRGLALNRDGGDAYAQALLALVRHGADERKLDRFLVAAIIEARSEERLRLLAENLKDPGLKKLYAELAKSEDGHQVLFLKLANALGVSERKVQQRLDELLADEAAIVKRLPLRAAIHG
jgi:tRNA 2-(methylsulfanyl)-N6-isopentenyladenosine37 hydroxylase